MDSRTDKYSPFIYDEYKELLATRYEEQLKQLADIPDEEKFARFQEAQQAKAQQVTEWRNKLRSFKWYSRHLMIQEKNTHHLMPLDFNEVQSKIDEIWLEEEKKNKPVRLIILKARRMGCSTYIQGRLTHRACTRRNFSGLTVAHDLDTSGILFSMAERMYLRLPDDIKPKGVSKERNKRIDLSNDSGLRIETAVDPEAGRGMAALGLHCSEVGFWPYPEKTLLALRQIVPESPGTFIVLESTANGSGNYFEVEWNAATEGRSGYVPIFFGWNEYAQNCREIPEVLIDGVGKLLLVDEYEEELRNDGLSDEQIYWRRWAIKHLAGGNLLNFQQEYPYTAQEAFIVSGRPYFKQYIKNFKPREPRRIGDLAGSCERGTPINFVDDEEGDLRVYQVPRPNTRYVLFADPSGILKDNEFDSFPDRTEAHDYCAAQVINCRTFDQVAVYRSRVENDQFAFELYKLGKLYNDAIIAVEMTGGYGLAPASILLKKLNYHNLYFRQEVDTVSGMMGRSIGWMTSPYTRPLMLDALSTILRDHPEKLADKNTFHEMLRFVISRNGKPVAAPGSHDDLVMSAAGGYMLAQQYAQAEVTVPPPEPPKPFHYGQ